MNAAPEGCDSMQREEENEQNLKNESVQVPAFMNRSMVGSIKVRKQGSQGIDSEKSGEIMKLHSFLVVKQV